MISFIVPAYNEERLLGATLQAINQAVQALDGFEALGRQAGFETVDLSKVEITAELASALDANTARRW